MREGVRKGVSIRGKEERREGKEGKEDRRD